MFCDVHKNTELRLKAAPDEERGGTLYTVQIMYCPHCCRDLKKRLIGPDGATITDSL